MSLMKPLKMTEACLSRQPHRIASPENLAAMTAPHDTRSILMQRTVDSKLRQLWLLTQALANLRPRALICKNIKNTDRSEEVTENTRSHDVMPEKKSDFVSENSQISWNFAEFRTLFRDLVSNLRPKTARKPVSANPRFTLHPGSRGLGLAPGS